MNRPLVIAGSVVAAVALGIEGKTGLDDEFRMEFGALVTLGWRRDLLHWKGR